MKFTRPKEENTYSMNEMRRILATLKSVRNMHEIKRQ